MTDDEFRTELNERIKALDPKRQEGDVILITTDTCIQVSGDVEPEIVVWNQTQDRPIKIYDDDKNEQVLFFLIDLVNAYKLNGTSP